MDTTPQKKTGPRKTCPACSSLDVSDPVYCSPTNRAMIGFLIWCRKEGKHLHQKCRRCKFKWDCKPAVALDL